MSVKQISVFLENRPGTLQKMTDVLSKNKINMRAISLAETKDFGIARVIVDDDYEATQVLKEENFINSLTPVLAVEIKNENTQLFSIDSVDETIQEGYNAIMANKEEILRIFR